MHTQTFNNNLKDHGVVESKRNIIRKGLVHELLNALDTVLCSVLCSYFAQRSGERDASRSEIGMWKKLFKGWTVSFEVWSEAAKWREERRTAKEKKGELGSGKPYDGCSEVELTLDIPVVSWEWRRDEGEEEERIRTEE